MDGVIEDIAAVGVDHVDRHLAAAVVHLVAHGSVAVNLGIAQHEVITFPLDGIAPARDVFVRAHLERHPVGTQCPEAVTNPGKYPGGTVGGRRQRAGPLRRTGGSGRSRGTGGGTENGIRSGTGRETRRGTGGESGVNNGRPMEAKERMEARGGISLKTGGRGVAAGKAEAEAGTAGKSEAAANPQAADTSAATGSAATGSAATHCIAESSNRRDRSRFMAASE